MKMLKSNTIVVSVTLLAALSMSSCMQKKSGADNSAQLLKIDEEGSQDLSSEAGTPDALCSYLDSAGYFPGNTYPAGTEVAFSTSYGVDAQNSNSAEAGQAHGVIESDGFFNQRNMTTTQLLICPGSFSSTRTGKCAWKMSGDDGYAELARRVVCNKAGTFGSKGRLHPGYESMKVSKVSFKASTAGRSYSHSDAVKVELAGGVSKTQIYFAKGIGLVATEFRERSSPDGTAKVYIGAKASSDR